MLVSTTTLLMLSPVPSPRLPHVATMSLVYPLFQAGDGSGLSAATEQLAVGWYRYATEGTASDVLFENFAGCVPPPLDWKGVLLIVGAAALVSRGYNTNTNKEREATQGPGVQRRAFLLLLGLQVPLALGRGQGGKVCTVEERKEKVNEVLRAKGYDVP
jgi:hypothetical protein